MPTLQLTDETFLTTAPARFTETFEIAQPPAAVWAQLTGDRPLHWCRALSIHWTGAPPFGVGTRRTARILGVLVVQERFFIWEEGHRKAFCVTDSNLPVFKRVAEDFVVEPLGSDSSRFTWTIALEPRGIFRYGSAANKLLVKSLFDDTRRHFAA